MARRLAFDNDPNMEYPLSYRLAQFLLQSSQQLGGYEQGLAEQSKGASNVLESMERQDIARDELKRRTQEDLYTKEYRTADLADKAAARQAQAAERQATAQERADKAALEGRKRKAGGTFLQNLGQLRTTQEPLAPIPEQATAISPQAEDRTLANFLWGQRPSTPLEAFRGMDAESQQDLPEHIQTSVLKEAGETPKAFEQPATAAPGTGVWNPVTKRYDVPVPKTPEPKEPPAPSAERDYHAIATQQLGAGAAPSAIAQRARELAQADQVARFKAQGEATGQALVSREQAKYTDIPIGDDAAKWVGPGGKPVNPGLSRKEAVAAGARPLSGVDEVKSLRAAAGLARYLRQYIPLLDAYPEAGSSDAMNLVSSGVEGAKLYLARKSGGAATRIEALEGQVTKLIRAWGDTANAAVQERTTTLKGVPGYVETKQSAREKLTIILDQAIGSFEDLGVEAPKDLLDLRQELEGGGSAPPGFTKVR